MPSVSVFLLGFRLDISSKNQKEIIKVKNVGVERGVATRRTQMVWPMMTVTETNFEGFTRKNLQMCAFRSFFPHFCKFFKIAA